MKALLRIREYLVRPMVASFVALVLVATVATAGSLTPSGSLSGTMYTLGQLYDSIAGTFNSGSITANQNGSLMENLKYIEENMPDPVGSDSLDFDEFVDSMTLDADTTIASGGYALSILSNVLVGGTISSPYGGFGASEHFGAGSTVTSSGGTAIGYAATAGYFSVAAGFNANATGVGTAIGAGSFNTSFGFAGGNSAYATSTSVAIGGGAFAHANSIVLGSYARSSGPNQLVLGGSDPWSAGSIYEVFFGQGVSRSVAADVTLNPTGGAGTNVAGAALRIAGGRGTGSANGGALRFLTAPASASGTTQNALVERMTITPAGYVGIGTTNFSPPALLGALGGGRLNVAQNIGVTGATTTGETALYLNMPTYMPGGQVNGWAMDFMAAPSLGGCCGGYAVPARSLMFFSEISNGSGSGNQGIKIPLWLEESGNIILATDTGTGFAAGSVGVGNASPDAKLDVRGNILASNSGNVDLILNSTTSDDTKFTIRSVGASNRLDILGSASQAYMTILKGGNVGIASSSPTEKFAIEGRARFSGHIAIGENSFVDYDPYISTWGYTTRVGMVLTDTYTNLDIDAVEGTSVALTINPAVDAPSALAFGNSVYEHIPLGNTSDVGSLVGNAVAVIHQGTGTLSGTAGFSSAFWSENGPTTAATGVGSTIGVLYPGSSIGTATGYYNDMREYRGSVGTAIGFSSMITPYDGASIGSLYHIRTYPYDPSLGPTNVGSLTNAYGVYIGDMSQTVAANHYNIYSEGLNSRNYFGGNVGIGATSPEVKLEVSGAASISGTLRVGGPVGIGTSAPTGAMLRIRDVSGANNKLILESSSGLTHFVIGNQNGGVNQKYFTFAAGSGGDRLVIGGMDDNLSSFNNTFSIYRNGRVAIEGNTSISYGGLEVSGTASVSRLFVGSSEFDPDLFGGWTDVGTAVHLTTASDYVGIGTSAPLSELEIQSETPKLSLTNTQLVVQTWQLRNGALGSGSTAFDVFDATASSSRLVVQNDGNVMIGSTSNPANNARLFVFGGANGANIDVRGKGTISDQATMELEGSDYDMIPNSAMLQYFGPNGLGTTMGFSNQKLGQLAFINASSALIRVSNGTPLVFGTKELERMRISGDGNVGIGTTSPLSKMHIASASDDDIFRLEDSDGTCDHNPEAGSETVTCSSDERLKTDIVDSEGSALEYFSAFRIRDYSVRASGDRMTGVIAQELLETHPELVSEGADGMYMVSQPSVWQLVKGMQELALTVEQLQTMNVGLPAVSDDETWFSAFFERVVERFASLFNVQFEEDRITVQELCLDDVCVTKSQLRELLEASNLLQSSDEEEEEQPDAEGAVEEETPLSEPASSDAGLEGAATEEVGEEPSAMEEQQPTSGNDGAHQSSDSTTP